MSVTFKLIALFCATAAAACGCDSAPAAPTATTAPPAIPITAAPKSVLYNTGTAPTTLVVSNARAVLIATIDDATIADVAVSGSGGQQSVVVSPIAAGTATVSISDGASSVSVPVMITQCEPPVPSFTLVSPTPNTTAVLTTTNSLLFSYSSTSVPSAQLPGVVATYRVRLISTPKIGYFGGMLAPLSATPPGYPVPASNAGYASASIAALASATTYRVQVFSPLIPCRPPVILGSFST